MSDRTIEVARYIATFRTWADVFSASGRDPEEPVMDIRRIIGRMLRELDGVHGTQPVERLCALCTRSIENLPPILTSIHKSNLLARMIYGGEALRERRCPIHDGRWSGYGWCSAGCSTHPDPNITGWLPNAYVEAWPERPVDPRRDALEAAIAARFERDELVVYADYLQQLGDPRGYLMAIDPMAGFPEHHLRDADGVRSLFDRVDGRFVRRVTIECEAREVGGIVRFLAARELRWLVEVAANHPIAADDFARLRARAPKVVIA